MQAFNRHSNGSIQTEIHEKNNLNSGADINKVITRLCFFVQNQLSIFGIPCLDFTVAIRSKCCYATNAAWIYYTYITYAVKIYTCSFFLESISLMVCAGQSS